MLKRYLPRVRDCGSPDEFAQLMREMLGELGGSHLGFYSPANTRELPPQTTADFGVDFDESYTGAGWRVAKVITGGPADQPQSRLYVGDVITQVNGRAIEAHADRGAALCDLADQPVVLTVTRDSATAAPVLAGVAADKQEQVPAGERSGTAGDNDEETGDRTGACGRRTTTGTRTQH